MPPPPPLPPAGAEEPAAGFGAMGIGLVGVPPPFPGVLLVEEEEGEEEEEKSWRRAELGEANCSRRKVAMGDASPGHGAENICNSLHTTHQLV